MSQVVPQKRQRSNSNGDPRRRSNYWFEDGNIVFQAEDTLFRVHQSILSRHSQVFKDMFAMPQPSTNEESDRVENCPVIQVSDTAEDITNIMSILYDTEKSLDFGRKFPAKVLASMLRLGKKYEIEHFEIEALRRLRHDHPTTLNRWDNCHIRRRIEEDDEPLDTAAEVISIAHEFGLFTLLPAAYVRYLQHQHLSNLPIDCIIPMSALAHCNIGNTRILGYIKERSVDALCPPIILPSKACSSGGKCSAERWKTIKNLPVWSFEEVSGGFGVFESWSSSGPLATKNLCSACQNEARKLTEKVRLEFWSILPTFFGLAAWENLKDADSNEDTDSDDES